jgi:nickel transport protein
MKKFAMNRRELFTLICFFAFMLMTQTANLYAHGVQSSVDQGGIVIAARYDTGEVMSYAKVKITAPDAALSFQSGRTDRNGRFCFFPDIQGEWQVVIDDEMGHRIEVQVPIDETLVLQANRKREGAGGSSFPRFLKALIGISVIFGIFGTILGWKGYRKLKQR